MLSGLSLLTAVAFVLFVRTGATTITLANGGGDGGELVRAAYEVGVPHPTGYPLWIILAHLSMIVIPVEPAHSVAIFSALCAAVAAGVAGLLTFELLQQWIAPPDAWLSLVASLCVPAILTTERLFWQQATIQETYALDSLLQLCGYFFLLRWIHGTSRFWPVALFTALGLANHLAAISLLGATLVAIVANRERFHRRDQVAAACCCALTGAFYAFLLIRARMHPLANWGDPSTFQRLLSLISASEYQHFLT
ncbi:MAG: DUF2723 domain-containing protein, partial [Chloroflexi bacterium]|nr:DUF2723 domain-containing protein [Chloroflexota bacterium]